MVVAVDVFLGLVTLDRDGVADGAAQGFLDPLGGISEDFGYHLAHLVLLLD